MSPTRARVIVDNDFSGDPDGLFQLAQQALVSTMELRLVIGSQLAAGDGWDPSDTVADNAAVLARRTLELCGRSDVRVVAGSNTPMVDSTAPVSNDAVDALIAEAMRDDERPLYVACGAGLTVVASALVRAPAIADRFTLVWIGGPEYPGLATPPPGASPIEYNLAIDPVAAAVVFDHPSLATWQVPRDAYRQTLVSRAELDDELAGAGELGSFLLESLHPVDERVARRGRSLGETYIMGDSPLVLLTALQSSFEPDASSSEWRTARMPRLGADGAPIEYGVGREVRVYTRLDTRLMFADMFARFRAHAR